LIKDQDPAVDLAQEDAVSHYWQDPHLPCQSLRRESEKDKVSLFGVRSHRY
jgi:hypothetical protein